MLSLGQFPIQLQHSTAVFHNPTSQNLHVLSKPHVSFSANILNPFDSLAFPGKKLCGFCSNALKTKNKGDFTTLSEMDGVEEFEGGFDADEFLDLEDDGEFKDDESEDDNQLIVPLQNMKDWLENRPRGFGEGKVYDTSVEDELLYDLKY